MVIPKSNPLIIIPSAPITTLIGTNHPSKHKTAPNNSQPYSLIEFLLRIIFLKIDNSTKNITYDSDYDQCYSSLSFGTTATASISIPTCLHLSCLLVYSVQLVHLYIVPGCVTAFWAYSVPVCELLVLASTASYQPLHLYIYFYPSNNKYFISIFIYAIIYTSKIFIISYYIITVSIQFIIIDLKILTFFQAHQYPVSW